MKYYTEPGSGSCRRVSAVIEFLNMDVEEIFIDLLSDASQQPEYLAINPNGMVPVLIDNDIVLWEASAIMIYLCEKTGDTQLFPQGPARYDVLRWMFWAAEHFRQPAPLYFEERLVSKFMGIPPDPVRIAQANRLMNTFTPILDAHLKNRRYVTGNQVTLADFDLAAPLSQMARTGIPYHQYPNIMRWYQHLSNTVPAWRVTGERLDKRMNSAIANASLDMSDITHATTTD